MLDVNWIQELVKQLKWVLSLKSVFPHVKIFVRKEMREASDVKIWKKCPRNQLSREMEQNDFTFLCTQRMSCRFKLTPSVNQMITFSKQPQCDEGSEQIASFSMHSDCVSYIWMQIDWMCRYGFVRLTSVVCLLYALNSFLTLTFKYAAHVVLKYSHFGPSVENNKLLTWKLHNYIYNPVFYPC